MLKKLLPQLDIQSEGSGLVGSKSPWSGRMVQPDLIAVFKSLFIQEDYGTEELLNSSIIDDGDVTLKLEDFNTACIILPNTIVMLKRIDGDEWNVAVVGSDPVQVKYSEDITDTLIKYVLLDIQPKESFKEFDVSSILIFKGVLRVVQGVEEEDTKSIDTNHFFLNLVQDIKDREEANLLHEDLTPSDET